MATGFTELIDLALLPDGGGSPFPVEIKLLDELGMRPDFAESKLSPGARQILHRYAEDSWDAIRRLKISDVQTRDIRQFLHGFLIFHLGRIPHGRAGTTR